MIEAPVRTISDVIADFLACRPPAEQLLKYYFPPVSQARLRFILEQNRESVLSEIETARNWTNSSVPTNSVSMLKTHTRVKSRNNI